ncbi:hypothetical protein [Acrocarpospora catenulata]|uniref:hypothetical protein n=1 Tax=Acrocarpospora catenulata TaxID=2836182 RepID=UPI001BD95484|nr:hypothetical protein [Acrocarpospora catenulata]
MAADRPRTRRKTTKAPQPTEQPEQPEQPKPVTEQSKPVQEPSCPVCDGTGQVTIARVAGRGPFRRTIETHALCLACA